MLEQNFDFNKLGGDYSKLIASVREGIPCSAFGMGQTERILSSLSVGRVLYIASDIVSARRVFETFREVIGNRAILLPSGPDIMTYKRTQSNESNIDRTRAIFSLCKGDAHVVVAPVEALLSYLPNVAKFKENIFRIEKNGKIDLSMLEKKLANMGYHREALVSAEGQFSVRGDIVDVFPINCKFPYRIDLFDTNVDSIRAFEPSEQVSMEETDEIEICPFTDLFLEEKQSTKLLRELEKFKTQSALDRDELSKFESICDEVSHRISIGDRGFALDWVFPLVRTELSTIFDYLTEGTAIVIDETKIVFDSLSGVTKEIDDRRKILFESGEILQVDEAGYLSKKDVISALKKFKLLAHQKITTANNFFTPSEVYSFKSAPVVRYTHNLSEFTKDMATWLWNDYKVFICAGDEKRAKQISRTLQDSDIDLEIRKSASFANASSCILPFTLTSGFILPARKIVVIGTYDIFPKKQIASKLAANRREVFSVPKVGDYVVHEKHGIGICEGVTKLSGNFGTKDFVVVSYRDNDKLYVPIDQMDLLDRFSGAERPKKLSKIGGVEFSAVKEKVKKKIKEMAFDLLELYAKRESRKGFVYNRDDMVQREFENAFPYTETEDQLVSISEIKKDMESGKVMDRLLCGDVGFGKTEVAIRAAFKAILSGKQVALVAPTTILSEQHFNTTRARLEPFGVKVGILNRFKKEGLVTKTISGIKSGDIDIVCGTHRVFSKDVEFKNLGLVILDEEQKFGVEDKEKLKLSESNVDVLTLSATPIPRTLHMSLSGIRDISIISTPPNDRLPVQTYVTEYSDGLVKDALIREISRGGQAFVLYNRVETIYAFKEKMQQLLPEARIVVGHGQLPASELEDVVYKFYNNLADILICTTIIENGIDLPNANTLIVVDSDKFGLSQLYQIRGRVGRGNRLAYAYFTYNKDKVLTEDSYKRLDAISEFTEFGSGFKIAMRDLEIRGSGNVLGAEQHGHMQKVGYDLYCKLLSAAVDELKGKKVAQKSEVVMKVGLDAFVPETYIGDSENRMTLYKNISDIDSEQKREKLIEDTVDIFGSMPAVVKNLIEIAYVKNLAQMVDCVEVVSRVDDTRLVFADANKVIKSENLANAVYKFSDICVLNFNPVPTIVFKVTGRKSLECFDLIKQFLIEATKNAKK